MRSHDVPELLNLAVAVMVFRVLHHEIAFPNVENGPADALELALDLLHLTLVVVPPQLAITGACSTDERILFFSGCRRRRRRGGQGFRGAALHFGKAALQRFVLGVVPVHLVAQASVLFHHPFQQVFDIAQTADVTAAR